MPDNQRRMRFPIPVVKPGEHLPAAVRANGLDLRRFNAPHDFAFPADDQPFEALDAYSARIRFRPFFAVQQLQSGAPASFRRIIQPA